MKRLSLGKKMAGVMALIAVVAAGISVLAAVKMGQINEKIQYLAEVSLQRVAHVNRIKQEVVAYDAEQQRFVLDRGGNWETITARIEEIRKEVERQLAGWTQCTQEADHREIEAIRSDFGSFDALAQRVLQITRKSPRHKAEDLSRTAAREAYYAFETPLEPLAQSYAKQIDEKGDKGHEAARIAYTLESILNYFRGMIRGEKNMLISLNAEDIEKFSKQPAERSAGVLEKLKFLEGILPDKEKPLARNAVQHLETWMGVFQQEAAIMRDSSQATTLSNTEGKVLLEKVRARLDQAVARNADQMNQDKNECQSVYARAKITMFTTSLGGILLAGVLGYLVLRSVNRKLDGVIGGLTQGSEQVSAAAAQVASSGQNLASGASEQASTLEEISSSLEEMASLTRQNAQNARQANGMAGEARGATEKGIHSMERMSEAISLIRKSSDETAKIVKTIDEIAFQTNLLALNAAVEAARAGEAGKGFAVVAEEVRNLAQRSADAAKNTASLIGDSQKNAEHGVVTVKETEEILKNVADRTQKVAQLVAEVSAANDEQSKGVEQINIAVSQLDKVTQSNAATAEESAAAGEELEAQSRELGRHVVSLHDVVHGATASRAEAVPESPGPERPLRPAPTRKAKAAAEAVSRGPLASTLSAPGSRGNGSGALVQSAARQFPLDESELEKF